MQKSHKIYLDILKLFCIFLVVYNHTPCYHVPLENPLGTNILQLAFSRFDKIAVPIFFIISGALLLNKQESFRELYSHRVARFAIVILIFVFIQICYFCYKNNTYLSITSYISACFHPNKMIIGEATDDVKTRSLGAAAAWFLYAYFATLLVLPLLRAQVQNMKGKLFLYLAGLIFSLKVVVPIIFYLIFKYYGGFYIHQYLPICTSWLFCFIFGHYLENILDIRKVTSKHLIILGLCSLLMLTIDVLLIRDIATVPKYTISEVQKLAWYSEILIPTYCFVYLLVKKLFINVELSQKCSKLLRLLGGTSMMVMLTENIFRKEYATLFSNYNSDFSINILVTAMTVLSGVLIGVIVRLIPGLKRIF